MKHTLLAILTFIALTAVADRCPKFEMRGAWIATVYNIDWPSQRGTTEKIADAQKAELDTMLTRLGRAGFNAVFLQVRPMADALYKSSYEPWSHHITGKRGAAPAYDPLQFAIDRCHALGIELHAWINPFRIVPQKLITQSEADYSNLWMTNIKDGKPFSIMNPGLPEARRLISDVVKEIAEEYDVDGIVFDDYFYSPEFLLENETAADWKQFKSAGYKGTIADWRRDNVNKTINLVYDTLSKIKNGKIRFGVAPQGIAGGNGIHSGSGIPKLTGYGVVTGDSQYSKIYCDPVAWMLEGCVDYISPQIYWTRDNPRHSYTGLCRWWYDTAKACSRHCFPSAIIARFGNKNSLEFWKESLAQLSDNRTYAAETYPGTVFYSATYISGPKCKGFGDFLASKAYQTKALMPPMKWKKHVKEVELRGLKHSQNQLKWSRAGDCRYVVYAIPSSVGSIDALSATSEGLSSDYIIAMTYSDSYIIPEKYTRGYRFAVAPYDRFGMEWNPVFIK